MESFNQEQHIMVLDRTYASGSEEWCCPVCGRRLLIQWHPSFNWMILNPGDETATHSGAKGGMSADSPQVQPAEEVEYDDPQLTQEEEARLQPWIDWMEKTNFDRLWEKNDWQ